MRKLSILSYIFAGLMFTSCDGYLKEDPRDQLYPEERTIPLRMAI